MAWVGGGRWGPAAAEKGDVVVDGPVSREDVADRTGLTAGGGRGDHADSAATRAAPLAFRQHEDYLHQETPKASRRCGGPPCGLLAAR